MTVLRLFLRLSLPLIIAACASPDDEAGGALEESIVAEPEPVIERAPDLPDTDCDPTEDDGIGGTGCSVD